jgi:hypothetical protein
MQRQLIGDMLWVLNTPSLVDDPEMAESVLVDAASIDHAQLSAFIANRQSHRVGYYFESLLAFWLQHIRGVEMVDTGGQIKVDKQTVGELDFLFRDEHGRLNHWEATVKFFLHFPNENGSHFPGPNASDNFERKITKLFEKQLRLSETYYPDVQVRRGFVKGIMFYHPSVGEPQSLPERMSPHHLRGKWIRESELDFLNTYEAHAGQILMKPNWLAAPTENLVPIPELRTQLNTHFANSRYPVMLSITTNTGDSEIQRMFVAPDSWPQTG